MYMKSQNVFNGTLIDLQILNLLSFSSMYIHNWSHTETSLDLLKPDVQEALLQYSGKRSSY